MFRMHNNLITITRGDSASFDILLNIGSTVNPIIHEMKDNDKLYFGVTEPHKPFELGLIRKVLTKADCLNDYVIIKLKPEDTEFILPGNYYYSLKLLTEDENVYTIIDKRKFTVID